MNTIYPNDTIQKIKDLSEPILAENAGFQSDELIEIIKNGILAKKKNPQLLDLTRIYLDGGYRKDLTSSLYEEVDLKKASIKSWNQTISCLNEGEIFIAIGCFVKSSPTI